MLSLSPPPPLSLGDRGPTRVNLKQSLWLNFSVDTTKREYGAMGFLIFSDWRDLAGMTPADRSSFLALQEAKEPLYTVPAGFRSERYSVAREFKQAPCDDSLAGRG